MTIVVAVVTICQMIVAIAAALCVLRLLRGPSIADRAVAVDTLTITIGVEIVLSAAKSGVDRNIDFLLIAALVAFIGTTAVGRFIERRGAR